MKFISNEPALLVGKTLVLADIHLGVEYDYKIAGYKMPSQTQKTTKRIKDLLKKTKAEKLLLMGDIKHKVPGTSFQEQKEIPEFFDSLSSDTVVEVIPGNHDGGLQAMVPGIKIHPSTGLLLGKTFLCHGHSWPSADFLRSNFLVISHNHPIIELKDSLGFKWREKAWIRAELKRDALENLYNDCPRLPELVIMPAFSNLVGGFAMNHTSKKPLGPLVKAADLENAKAFLLDGTFLGELEEL